jgi:Putative Actinobacterial Holin-X, holin superfamily III
MKGMVITQPNGSLGAQLAHLAKLQGELALAETRSFIVSAALTAAIGIVAIMAMVASAVVLIVGGLAPLFGAHWQHLVVAGSGVFIAASLALAWSAWRVRRLEVPRETLQSLTENWEWLVAQVKSRLTLR